MTAIGTSDDPQWEYLVRRPPASAILDYLLSCWVEYESTYSGTGVPLAERTEPQLTEALGAYLRLREEEGLQPFHGDFFAELQRVDLGPDGKRIVIGRSDIEWRLYGSPNFVVEFKVIGNGRPAQAYVSDGMVRFVDGRYAPRSAEGAMWAFLRPGSSESEEDVEALIDASLSDLKCEEEEGCYRVTPSTMAPATARFDSIHAREPEWPKIRLAHVFVWIAPLPDAAEPS